MNGATTDRSELATVANEIAVPGTIRPVAGQTYAPTLTAESSRETLIAWLSWNDPNGSYADPEVWQENGAGLLDAGWYCSTDEDGRRGPFATRTQAAGWVRDGLTLAEAWELVAAATADA